MGVGRTARLTLGIELSFINGLDIIRLFDFAEYSGKVFKVVNLYLIFVGALLERFNERIDQLEEIIKQIAIEITTGTFVEKLPPEKVWEKTGDQVNLMLELIKELREYLSVIKPEKLATSEKYISDIYERLDIFKEYLGVEKDAVVGSSSASMEELRKALVNITEFISYCRHVKSEPNEVIDIIINLRQNQAKEQVGVSPERLKVIGDIVKETQDYFHKYREMSVKMENKLEALKTEYEQLVYSLKQKN